MIAQQLEAARDSDAGSDCGSECGSNGALEPLAAACARLPGSARPLAAQTLPHLTLPDMATMLPSGMDTRRRPRSVAADVAEHLLWGMQSMVKSVPQLFGRRGPQVPMSELPQDGSALPHRRSSAAMALSDSDGSPVPQMPGAGSESGSSENSDAPLQPLARRGADGVGDAVAAGQAMIFPGNRQQHASSAEEIRAGVRAMSPGPLRRRERRMHTPPGQLLAQVPGPYSLSSAGSVP